MLGVISEMAGTAPFLSLSDGWNFAQEAVVLASRPFSFLHAGCAISGKANREHTLGNGAIAGVALVMLAWLCRCMFVCGNPLIGRTHRRDGKSRCDSATSNSKHFAAGF